jgi:hypothetical protein
VSITILFLSFTVYNLKSFKLGTKKEPNRYWLQLDFTDYKHNRVFYRFDLTKDNRYTLLCLLWHSQTSKRTVVHQNIPARRFACGIQKTTAGNAAALEEFQAYNQNIVFEFINPLENEDTSMDNIKVVPKRINACKHNGWWQRKQSQAMVSMGYSSISEQSQYSTIEK